MTGNPDYTNIPSIGKCYQIIKQNRMLPNILQHSNQVARVACVIVDNLNDDIKLNKDLVIAASLLHDITKTRAISTYEPHDITGGKVLREYGLYEIAAIVEDHIELKNFQPDEIVNENEIVYYADKRVMHRKIVSLKERIKDVAKRYATTPIVKKALVKKLDIAFEVEKKIAEFLKKDINKLFQGIEEDHTPLVTASTTKLKI